MGNDNEDEEKAGMLPNLKIGEHLGYNFINATQRFTSPPYRFTEASLVKQLEELGIGRPSTYAPTISTVQRRGYVEKGQNEGLERIYEQIILTKDVDEILNFFYQVFKNLKPKFSQVDFRRLAWIGHTMLNQLNIKKFKKEFGQAYIKFDTERGSTLAEVKEDILGKKSSEFLTAKFIQYTEKARPMVLLPAPMGPIKNIFTMKFLLGTAATKPGRLALNAHCRVDGLNYGDLA